MCPQVADIVAVMTSPASPNPTPRQPSAVTVPLSAIALQFTESLLRPVRALRFAYVPLLMVYFAYGALGIIDVTRDIWIKESLTLSPSELASIAVWLSLPWTVKMVFGEFVDSVPIFGSQRRAYILIGAACTASGLIVLAGAAGQWLTFLARDGLYVLGALLIVFGTVIQDVVADAMSTEVVPRSAPTGSRGPKTKSAPISEWCRCWGGSRLSVGILSVAGLSGWLARIYGRETVFLLALVVPAISVAGVFMVRSETSERRPIDWRILGGGLAFGFAVLAIGLGGVPFGQEIIFLLSMAVVCTMLVYVTSDLDPANTAGDPVCRHHHLCIPGDPVGGRRLFLVDARRSEIRRGVLWDVASDRGDHRTGGFVASEQAS